MQKIPVLQPFTKEGEQIIFADKFEDLPLSNGTSLQSSVTVSYADLVRLFGEPNTDHDGYKSDAEWLIYTMDGVCTIYNYKDGRNYLGSEGLATKDITDWHLGGHNKNAPEIVKQFIEKSI